MPPNTIAIDFDGVIHSFVSGWQGGQIASDPPVPGIAEAIADLRRDHRVVIVSSRCLHDGGTQAIADYLTKYGIEVDGITGDKIPALVYIDDRAVTFNGRAHDLVTIVRSFRPWHEVVV